MEKENQHAWKMRFSYRNATLLLCFFNLITALFLLQGFLNAAISRKDDAHQLDPSLMRYVMESEKMRRAMEPVELIKRVKEIEQEAYADIETVPEVDPKQTAAIDLSKRLNDFRAMNDAKNQKALEEWLLRKIERARQRENGKNGISMSQ